MVPWEGSGSGRRIEDDLTEPAGTPWDVASLRASSQSGPPSPSGRNHRSGSRAKRGKHSSDSPEPGGREEIELRDAASNPLLGQFHMEEQGRFVKPNPGMRPRPASKGSPLRNGESRQAPSSQSDSSADQVAQSRAGGDAQVGSSVAGSGHRLGHSAHGSSASLADSSGSPSHARAATSGGLSGSPKVLGTGDRASFFDEAISAR
ncbi:hypothetical protein WJX72_007560 [[Myrmecia] bisecta]|uniref:Uncharacterized protein n=1 Tax=[Myrmecia] bisecta TaxID=41462 RepID=A0AAW1R8L7_9CHLO